MQKTKKSFYLICYLTYLINSFICISFGLLIWKFIKTGQSLKWVILTGFMSTLVLIFIKKQYSFFLSQGITKIAFNYIGPLSIITSMILIYFLNIGSLY